MNSLNYSLFFASRCSENCAVKLDPSAKFSLAVDCKSKSCSSTAVFQWALTQHNLSQNNAVSLEQILYSKASDKDLYLKPGVLIQGMRYTLRLTATAPDGAVYELSYPLDVNTAPRNGEWNSNGCS